ncbi:MAG TPA: SpvB/TcaC N-terminal domain-containing protein, partial [Flavobacterium sp.]
MKRILLLSFLLLQTIIYSQESDYGNQPVVGVTPVKRINDGSLDEPEKVPQTTTIPATAGTPTGNSSEVGITEGQLEVSLTGGATYSIPIAVPPGINGVTPQVSLSYNSQGGNDLAGYGWNINGVSSISRIPSTLFHDGIIDGVDFDNLDRFALDGQRLILKSGTYGGDGAEYETENFSTVKITSHGVSPFGANYGPAYFVVQYPDGSVARYGNTTDSRSITKWSVTFWQNPQGIRINYLYSNENNQLIIDRITYGPENNLN